MKMTRVGFIELNKELILVTNFRSKFHTFLLSTQQLYGIGKIKLSIKIKQLQ